MVICKQVAFYQSLSAFRFRRQHEQLRQVIVRVLRPVATTKAHAGTPLEETAPKIEPVVDEAADANAIEVTIYKNV